ncbi:MAG: hypothetical protein FWC36_06410 [Spirochaetes bacterium]|nr:hypothetical protein [Spirochaetota bacterium]
MSDYYRKENVIISKMLNDRLNMIEFSEKQINSIKRHEQNERINNLLKHAALQAKSYKEQIAFLKEKRESLIDEHTKKAGDRYAAEKAANEAIRILEAKHQEEKIEQFRTFLLERAALEGVAGLEKMDFLDELHKKILAKVDLNCKEQVALERAKNDLIREMTKKRVEDLLTVLGTASETTSALIEASGIESKEALKLQRKSAVTAAAINTYQGVTKALATGTPPASFILAAKTLALGLSKQRQIHNINLPSFETGGRFFVPTAAGINRVDSSFMRVNPGEQVDVTPRGEAGNNLQQFVFKVNEQVIFDIVNKGGKSGDIYVFEPAGNL